MKSAADISTLDISPRDRAEVARILSQYFPEYTVWAFGSRVTGTVKPYSDLDIVILTDKPLSLERMAIIKDAFAESDLPIRVDVVDWSAASASFQEIIRRKYVVIQEGSSP